MWASHLTTLTAGIDGIVEAGLLAQSQRLLEEVPGIALEDGVEGKVAEPSMLLTAVIAEVYEVFDVVVGLDILKVLGQVVRVRRGLKRPGRCK